MLSVEISIPAFELRIKNEPEALRAAGELIAQTFRGRITGQVDEHGVPLNRPKDGGTPMVRSGELLRSIAVVSNGSDVSVGPQGARNQRVAAILSHAARKGHRRAAQVFDVLPDDQKRAAKAFTETAQAELEANSSQVIG